MPGSLASATAVPAAGAVTTSTLPALSGGATSTVVDDAPPPARPRGRHARADDLDDELEDLDDHVPASVEPAPLPAPAPRSGGGRHARGREPAPRTRARAARAAAVPFEPLDLEGRELAPEEVDAIADQMLDQLAVTETRPRFFDPDDLPGGRVAFMAGLGLAVVVVLVALYTILGLIFG